MATATDKTARPDIYTSVTNRIVEQLEAGTRPWLKPWNATHAAGRISRPLRHNAQPYSGINVIVLWMQAELSGYLSPFWLTFKQAQELGGHVKKGEHGSQVVYASTFKKKDKDDAGVEIEQEVPFLKQYVCFNADQCEGLPQHFYQLAELPKEKIERIEAVEQFVAATNAEVRYGGNQAYYSVRDDRIQLPPFETFRDAESHAATVIHELTHWTRHPSRLNRDDFGRKRRGDEGYAMEELVAELGSAFLCADLCLTPEVRADHASYIEHWLKVLKDDKRAIFTAASHASKAADYLHGLQPHSIA
ncbi:MAG TPA: zincin-like metallopeptidase domain-containing protein [Pirellulales bacterium]|nr:zincin-like metallopeptidase domain-containing protein [Pirellulales bacterium]